LSREQRSQQPLPRGTCCASPTPQLAFEFARSPRLAAAWPAGDFADLPGLAELRLRHGFLLAIDEAHATLVCGKQCASQAMVICMLRGRHDC